MLKRVLHAANQVITHPETHIGRELTIENTVNDKIDLLKVTGDSWQLRQEEIKDTDGNVIQSAIPSPEYPSEILSVGGELVSHGWNQIKKKEVGKIRDDTGTIHHDWLQYRTITVYFPTDGEYEIYVSNKSPAGIYLTEEWFDGTFSTPYLRIASGMRYKINRGKGVHLFSYKAMPDTIDAELLDSCIKVQITKADVVYPYDCYRGSSITLPELRAIRDEAGNIVAEDVLWMDRKQKRAWVERNVKCVILNGTEGVILNNDYNGKNVNTNRFSISILDACKLYYKKYSDCDTLGWIDSMKNYDAVGHYTHGMILYINMDKDAFPDAKTFNTWLAENPITVHYMLKKQEIEELPYTDYLLSTAQYQTNIYFTDINENLKPTIEATVKVLCR